MITVQSKSYKQDPAAWDSLLAADPLQYPFGMLLDQDYSAAFASQWAFEDLSMLAIVDGQPAAGLQLTMGRMDQGDQEMNFYGRPAFLRINRAVGETNLAKAERDLADAFLTLHQSHTEPPLRFLEMSHGGVLSDFAVSLLKAGAIATPVYKQLINLQSSEEDLRRDVRKSYKSLISWGEKNLAITIYDQSNITPAIMDQFRQLHITVVGKETRSPLTWELQYRQIAAGQSFAVMGELDGALVTAALFLCSPLSCIYGVSASIRELFDKPLSHALIWRGILEAKRKGCSVFEMGELLQLYANGYSDKEKTISTFKRGFGGQAGVQLKIIWPKAGSGMKAVGI